jgi:hypothetical protein
MANTCCVCIEEFTKQPHKKQAKCPYCDIQACVKCTQTYLVNSNEDPHCMGCRKAWSREVLDTLLLTTWINQDYKKHRENILVEREKSRLPAAQIIIENIKRAEELEPERIALVQKLAAARAECNRIEIQYSRIITAQANLRRGQSTEQEAKRVFVMPCPATNCRGFLSQAYKCGVCDIYVCPDCREIKGTTRDEEHTCDPATVETVKAIKKDTRPCPECGTNIFKIEGCDQMYCTNCNTPFSWKSGQKITSGAIHNPHYFEFLRRSNNGVMPRQPGDIPCGQNLPSAWTFDREISRKFPQHLQTTNILYNALRTFTHIQYTEIPRYTNHADDLDNTEYNVKYLRNEITETRWKQLLQQREKRRLRRDEVRQRLEAVVGIASDVYSTLMRQMGALPLTAPSNQQLGRAETYLKESLQQLRQMREIFNTSMMDISRRYKCNVLQLTENLLHIQGRYATERKQTKNAKSDTSTTETDSDDEVVTVT